MTNDRAALSVLLLSQRLLADLPAFCLAYELEDIVAAVTDAVRIDAKDQPSLEFSRRAYKLVRLASGSSRLARQIAPYPRSKVILDREFDLFFPVFSHTYEVYTLATIPNWRQHCRKAACYITEVWSNQLPKYLVEMLAQFDHIFAGNHHAVHDVMRITGRPCTYLPLAVDVLRFAPSSLDAQRPIEVCNLGRRSQVTHRALLEDTERRQSFYIYDTVATSGVNHSDRTFHVDNPLEHRRMLANFVKRSRYYIANRGYANRPGPDVESARFYEGAAAGAVMIGEAPRSEEFVRQFDWPDAVIPASFDSPDIARLIADLNSDPDRLRAIRQNNVREAALRHDWLHRIQAVLNELGLPTTAKMQDRAARLDEVAMRSKAKCPV